MKKAGIWLKKNGLFLIVILALCVSIVSFSMGLVLVSEAQYSTSNLSIEVISKKRVDFEDKIILETKIKNNGKKDISSIKFVIEIKDKNGNLLADPAGTLDFASRNELVSKETEVIKLNCSLDFDKNYNASWYMYNMPYEDLVFSTRVEQAEFSDGEKSYADNESELAWSKARTTGIVVAGGIIGLAAGCFVYIRMKKTMSVLDVKARKGK